jgi:CheY-like chemotaxis protein
MKSAVLLASSRTDVLETLPITLKLAGLDVLIARSGLDAIRQARSGWPHLIILDSTLPDMDGSTAADILRRLPSTAEIPSILLRNSESSSASPHNRTALLQQIAHVLSLCEDTASDGNLHDRTELYV